jgi:predicted dehydrogenase
VTPQSVEDHRAQTACRLTFGVTGTGRYQGTLIMALRTTVVGCGAVAQRLYRAPLRQLERQGFVCVTSLVDRDIGHAEVLRSAFPRAALHEDLEVALRARKSDLTLVLTPAHLHADQAILALSYGNHVLCEKPMATTSRRCAEMIAAAREKSCVLAVGMIRRFFPAFTRLKQLIASQAIGRVRSFSYQEGRKFDWEVTSPAGFRRSECGGAGLLFDIGPHVIDMLIWLFGSPRVVSYADDALAGVEANLVMELDFRTCSGSVRLSWDFPLLNELRVQGSLGEAVLRVDQLDELALNTGSGFKEVTVNCAYPADVRRPSRRALSPGLYTQSMYCQLIAVIRAIELGEPPAVDGETGTECIEAIESALCLAGPLGMPWLCPREQAAFHSMHWSKV